MTHTADAEKPAHVLVRAWRRQFPGLDAHSVIVTVAGSLALVVFFYHGRPQQLPDYLPSISRWCGRYAELGGYVYSHAFAALAFMLLPMLVVKAGLREKWSDYGLRVRGSGRECLIALGLYVAFLPLLYYVSTTQAFQDKYPKLRAIENDAGLFWLYESAYLLKWLAWEFFFRGFLLFGLKKKMGEYAVLASTLPFVVAHIGKPEAEMAAAIAAGFILCRLALSSRSILPGVILHFLVAGTVDFLACVWWR